MWSESDKVSRAVLSKNEERETIRIERGREVEEWREGGREKERGREQGGSRGERVEREGGERESGSYRRKWKHRHFLIHTQPSGDQRCSTDFGDIPTTSNQLLFHDMTPTIQFYIILIEFRSIPIGAGPCGQSRDKFSSLMTHIHLA